MNIVNLLLTKKPNGYPHNHGEGDAGLTGAVYRFNYYDGHYNSASAAEGSGKPTAIWYFTTDANGQKGKYIYVGTLEFDEAKTKVISAKPHYLEVNGEVLGDDGYCKDTFDKIKQLSGEYNTP